MKLIFDEFNDIWVWVEDEDHNDELSPQFDFEEDAIRWYDRIKNLMIFLLLKEEISSYEKL